MKKIILFLLSFGLLSLAQAGQETHGGDYVVCPNRKTVVLDYFQAQLPTFSGDADIADISQMNADQVIQYFSNRFSETLLGYGFDRYVRTIGDYKKWIVVDQLVDQDDEHLAFVPANCTIKQGAVRQHGIVYISRAAMAELSSDQIGVLAIHEALSEFLMQSSQDLFSSADVRSLITELLRQKMDYIRIAEIFSAYRLTSSYFCYGQFYTSSTTPVNPPGPTKYEGWILGFNSTANAFSGIFETNSGKKIDIFELQADGGFEFLHLFPNFDQNNAKSRTGKLWKKKGNAEFVLGKDMYCTAKNNECVSSIDNLGQNDISKKYGRLHLVLGSPRKMYFDQDPEKRVFTEGVMYGSPQTPVAPGCTHLNSMQRQSRGQLSR